MDSVDGVDSVDGWTGRATRTVGVMKIEAAAKRFFKLSNFLGPVGFVLLLVVIYKRWTAPQLSYFIVFFAMLMFTDGVLGLRFQRPRLVRTLERNRKSGSAKNERMILGMERFLNIVSIVGSISLMIFWFGMAVGS